VLAGIVVLLLLGALIYADRRAVNHRQLHVVNGYLAPIGVRLNDAEVSSVPPVTHVEFDIPEGEYRAQVTGPVNAEYTFTIASSFIARLFDRRVFVLNPGGMAVVLREEVLYIPRGRERDAEAPKIEAHFGFTCKEFERIDYPFADFPPEIQLKGSRETTKSRLAHYISPPLGLMYALLESHKPRAALDFAEWGIDTLPWGSQLLPLYAQVGANPEHHERVRKNLRSRLGRRPVDIVLHHAYQDCSRGAERAGLEAEYDQYLGEEPRSSALLYLRGRIAPGLQEAAKYFDQAVEIDPRNGWAHFAAAFGFASRGLWKDASQAVERALEIDPENLQVQELRFEIRLGLAEGEAMEKALGEEVAREAHADARKVFRLVGLASLRGDRDGALGHCDAFAKAHGASDPEGTAGIRSWLRCHSLYVLGDFAGMEQEAARARLGSGKTHRMEALIELGRVDEAARLGPDADEPDQDPFLPLTRSISCHLSGDAARAAAERTLALELMKGGAPEIARVPGFLAGPKAPPLADVLDLSIGPQDKATLLVVIAQTFPGAPAEFRAQARTLNASLNFPRHLLGRAIDKLESTR
jgi:tetratricopeptide (TPR) repeat protein